MSTSPATLQNPFCLEPVKGPERFFGRKKETRQALSFLSRRQSISVVGATKSGKTSFLFHVAHPEVRAQHGLAEEHTFVYINGRLLADRDLDQGYLFMLEETIGQVREAVSLDEAIKVGLERAVREAGSQTAYLGLHTLFRTAHTSGLQLVVLLDDFEFLAHNPHLGHRFFSALRSLHTSYRVAYLVASQSPLCTLERVLPESSPFFNIFHPVPLGLLTPEESHALVVTLLQGAGVKFPQFATDCILELGQNTPYHLQRAGHIAFQLWQENGGALRAIHCEKIREKFGRDEHYAQRA